MDLDLVLHLETPIKVRRPVIDMVCHVVVCLRADAVSLSAKLVGRYSLAKEIRKTGEASLVRSTDRFSLCHFQELAEIRTSISWFENREAIVLQSETVHREGSTWQSNDSEEFPWSCSRCMGAQRLELFWCRVVSA